MDRWLSRLARVLGTAAGAFAGVVAVQLMRLRRIEFLPGHPGFYINHVVLPGAGAPRNAPAMAPQSTGFTGPPRGTGVALDEPRGRVQETRAEEAL